MAFMMLAVKRTNKQNYNQYIWSYQHWKWNKYAMLSFCNYSSRENIHDFFILCLLDFKRQWLSSPSIHKLEPFVLTKLCLIPESLQDFKTELPGGNTQFVLTPVALFKVEFWVQSWVKRG